jgi:hypothetical protein
MTLDEDDKRWIVEALKRFETRLVTAFRARDAGNGRVPEELDGGIAEPIVL